MFLNLTRPVFARACWVFSKSTTSHLCPLSNLSTYPICQSSLKPPAVISESQTTRHWFNWVGPTYWAQLDQCAHQSRMRNERINVPRTQIRSKAWCFCYCLPSQYYLGFLLRTQDKSISMLSNGLSLSQWDSFYLNQIAASYLQFENLTAFSSDGWAICLGGWCQHQDGGWWWR